MPPAAGTVPQPVTSASTNPPIKLPAVLHKSPQLVGTIYTQSNSGSTWVSWKTLILKNWPIFPVCMWICGGLAPCGPSVLLATKKGPIRAALLNMAPVPVNMAVCAMQHRPVQNKGFPLQPKLDLAFLVRPEP